jgi:hypothetical protein
MDRFHSFVSELMQRAAQNKLSARILAVVTDMHKPPFRDQSFDLIWSDCGYQFYVLRPS